MVGEINLNTLLSSMSPEFMDGEYVFCSVQGELSEFYKLSPIATFCEAEGLTLVLPKETAAKNNLPFESVFKGITLTIHSSLDAVGLTAAISNKLSDKGISANVIAAYYHDHIFVQEEKAELALAALNEFKTGQH